MKRWLLLTAGLVFILAGLVQVVSGQSAGGYDWCYEFTFSESAEGFTLNVGRWDSYAGALAEPFTDTGVLHELDVSYLHSSAVIPQRVEVDLSFAAGNTFLSSYNIQGNVNAFGMVRNFNANYSSSSTPNFVIERASGDYASSTNFSMDWVATGYPPVLNVTSIKVYGNGVSPFGANNCEGYSDWCYEFDLISENDFALPNGYWELGTGLVSDQNNIISFSYESLVGVAPGSVTIIGTRVGRGGLVTSIEAYGTAFGIDLTRTESVGTNGIRLYYSNPNPMSGDLALNATIRANDEISIQSLLFRGRLANPFGVSNCDTPNMVSTPIQPEPTNTPTAIPTSLPTNTATPTATPTNTPTPTPTGGTPTPTPTPTARFYLGPVGSLSLSDDSYSQGWFKYIAEGLIVAETDMNSRIVGFIMSRIGGQSNGHIHFIGGEPLEGSYSPAASVPSGGVSFYAGNDANYPGNERISILMGTPAYPAATWVATAVPGGGGYQWIANPSGLFRADPGQPAYAYPLLGDNSPLNSQYQWQPILLGWPTPTPSPTPTVPMTATRTPTRTPGPTFTPNGSATATRTPTRTPYSVIIPTGQPQNITPLPTIYNYLTATGTAQIIGTPNPTWTPVVYASGTPVNTVTPGPSPTGGGALTPTAASPGNMTPAATIPPAGEYGDVAELGGNILGVGNNLFNMGRDWLTEFTTRVNGIITAWNTAPVTAPPGVPLCTTQPQLNQFCAILYFLRYTIFSGPIGSLIMPLATIVFDLFIVFLFIRMLRAILARLSKVTEV